MPSYIIEVQKTLSRSARLSSVGRSRLTMQAVPVPLKRPARFARGTEGSNPPSSTDESAANLPQPGPAIRRAVSFLLRHAPSHLHLVLTTRLEPPLSLGGLLAKNRLLGVDASVLRFDYSFARPISSRGACLHPPRADGTVRVV
jgi:hypothetical protein